MEAPNSHAPAKFAGPRILSPALDSLVCSGVRWKCPPSLWPSLPVAVAGKTEAGLTIG